MSLVQSVLKDKLLQVFNGMTGMSEGGDTHFAREVSKAIADYAQSGNITTVDAGAIPSGAFTGAGTGSISLNPSSCEAIILAACKAMEAMSVGGDSFLASQMALAIDSMMVQGTVNTNITGTVVNPSGVASAIAGTGRGTFIGVMATLQAGFLAAHTAMTTMTEGGDDFLADAMATTITAYLKAAVITSQGQASLLGSVGTGAMT